MNAQYNACVIFGKKPLHISLSLVPDSRLFGLLVLEYYGSRLPADLFLTPFHTITLLAGAEHTKVAI